jgi:hypothetical protein
MLTLLRSERDGEFERNKYVENEEEVAEPPYC